MVTPVSNPVRFKSRYALFDRFRRAVENAGANLMVVELALGDRPFEVTDPREQDVHEHDRNHPEPGLRANLQLRTWDELWHKEAQINLGISRLPSDWEYVAWIDADIEFMRQDWAEETVHLLQRYQVIQMFQNAVDLGPTGDVLQVHSGFVWSWQNNIPTGPGTMGYYQTGQGGTYYHPGYAWAARREAIDHLGGLFDSAILGAADHHMAWALVGRAKKSIPTYISAGYEKHLLQWEARATAHIRQDIGFMHGSIQHHFHGPKANRKYKQRWQIIKDHGFDPDIHLKRDWQGLWAFTDEGQKMRNDLRGYFDQRNEDDTRPE